MISATEMADPTIDPSSVLSNLPPELANRFRFAMGAAQAATGAPMSGADAGTIGAGANAGLAPTPGGAPPPSANDFQAMPASQPSNTGFWGRIPGQNKGEKLLSILSSGLQGALAGRAAQENLIAESGGRRAGGVGTGFEAGYMLPWQRAEAAQKYQLGQAALTPVETPYGTMPAEYAAKTVLPAFIRAGATEQAANTRAGAQTQAAQIGAGAKVQAAQIGSRFKVIPNVGLFDTQAAGGNGALLPGTSQSITITPAIAADYQLPQQYIGKPMTLQNLASIQRSSMFQNTPEMTASGPILINRRTAKATPVTGPNGQRYAPQSLATPIQVADPNNPGQTIMVPRGQAAGMSGSQSASVQVPKAAMRSEVPTQIGNLTVAFNTAIQHADLLQQALGALDNGDVRVLNSLKNRLKTEFGSSDVTNFTAIANAYNREITSMLSKGHITDAEIASAGGTLPTNASPQQILGAIQSYRALAQSKMNMLNQQKNAAIQQSQPNHGSNAAPRATGAKANGNHPSWFHPVQ